MPASLRRRSRFGSGADALSGGTPREVRMAGAVGAQTHGDGRPTVARLEPALEDLRRERLVVDGHEPSGERVHRSRHPRHHVAPRVVVEDQVGPEDRTTEAIHGQGFSLRFFIVLSGLLQPGSRARSPTATRRSGMAYDSVAERLAMIGLATASTRT